MALYFGGDLQLDPGKVRTVGAKEAIQRLRRMDALQPDAELDLLVEMRNGAAHPASDSIQAKGMISPLARTIATLLDVLGIPLDSFWERWTEALKAALNKQEDQAVRDMQLRITQARHAFEDRFDGLDPRVRKSAFEVHQPEMELKTGGVVVLKIAGAECPACGGMGGVTFEPMVRSSTGTNLTAVSYGCSLCGFQVTSPAEMEVLQKVSAFTVQTKMTLSLSYGPTLTPEQLEIYKVTGELDHVPEAAAARRLPVGDVDLVAAVVAALLPSQEPSTAET